MSERVQFVITAQEWDPSFEEVSPGGPEVGDPDPPWCSLCPLIMYSHVALSPGPDGQPFPGVRPAPLDLQL